jgi:hypothetical protein
MTQGGMTQGGMTQGGTTQGGTTQDRPTEGGPIQGRAGLGGIAVSIACFLVTALLGPSAMEPALPGSGPPLSLHLRPSPYLVIGLVAAGVLFGGLGLALCLHAVRRGWRPAPRPLLIAGLLATAAFALMPPVGSSDHLNYAAYGRMVVTGHDPYSTGAADLAGDPVARAVQEWRETPSLYGPIATGQQALAAKIGGDSVRPTVFVLSVTGALAFALVGLILYRFGDPLRSVLFWTLNPLMLFHLVSGAHNDTLGIAVAVGALVVFTGGSRREGRAGSTGPPRPSGHVDPVPDPAPGVPAPPSVLRALAAGALVGAGVALKLPAALVGGGPAWMLLRRRAVPSLVALFGAAGAVTLVAYSLVGSHAFDQVRRASTSVSFATPWHLLDVALGRGTHRTVIQIGALLLLAGLAVLLVRALPGEAGHEDPRIAAALVLAWLFAAPYALPWYDGLGWAVLALLPWSGFDGLLLARTAALSLAYLPARAPDVVRLPGDLSWLFTVVRPTVVPCLLTAVLVALVVRSLRNPRPAPASVSKPPARAGSRG